MIPASVRRQAKHQQPEPGQHTRTKIIRGQAIREVRIIIITSSPLLLDLLCFDILIVHQKRVADGCVELLLT